MWFATPLLASEIPLLFEEPTEEVKSTLQPWVDDLLANRGSEDPFSDYRFYSISEDTLKSIRNGEDTHFEFNYSDKYRYQVSIVRVREKDTDWYFSGKDIDNSDSLLVITTFPNGKTHGDFHVPGVGIFLIRATNTLPYHIVYLATGTYKNFE